jgi:hypothetical protein
MYVINTLLYYYQVWMNLFFTLEQILWLCEYHSRLSSWSRWYCYLCHFFWDYNISEGDPSDRAVEGVGLRPLASWVCGFESRRGHGYLSLVSVVCCQVEVSAMGWSLVQRNPTECGVSNCNLETSMRRPKATKAVEPWKKKQHTGKFVS